MKICTILFDSPAIGTGIPGYESPQKDLHRVRDFPSFEHSCIACSFLDCLSLVQTVSLLLGFFGHSHVTRVGPLQLPQHMYCSIESLYRTKLLPLLSPIPTVRLSLRLKHYAHNTGTEPGQPDRRVIRGWELRKGGHADAPSVAYIVVKVGATAPERAEAAGGGGGGSGGVSMNKGNDTTDGDGVRDIGGVSPVR